MSNFAVILACLLFFITLPLFKASSKYQKLYFITINISFVFWYWIPSIQMLNWPVAEEMANGITPDSLSDAAWTLLAYHSTLVLTMVLIRKKSLLTKHPDANHSNIFLIPVEKILLASTISALIMHFSDNGGIEFIFNILNGSASARTNMTFFNRSESANTSLIALWDLINIWAALFLISRHIISTSLISSGGIMAIMALGICFLSSGTRSILLMGIFAAIVSYIHNKINGKAKKIEKKKITRYIYLPLLIGSFIIIGLSFSARFESVSSGGENYLVDSVINNNDMFRELAYIKAQLNQYNPSSIEKILDFALTPFSFILPSFIGFNKNIPEHLIYFNLSRGNIDLIDSQGNIFPGIIGDFQMLFGLVGIIFFTLFLLAMNQLISLASTLITNSISHLAFQITMLSYIFISFRNIQGSLILLLVLGTIFLKLTEKNTKIKNHESIS